MKTILNLENVKILEDKTQYRIVLTCSSGQLAELEPMAKSIAGLSTALTIANEVVVGKFFLKGLYNESEKIERKAVMIEAPKTIQGRII